MHKMIHFNAISKDKAQGGGEGVSEDLTTRLRRRGVGDRGEARTATKEIRSYRGKLNDARTL